VEVVGLCRTVHSEATRLSAGVVGLIVIRAYAGGGYRCGVSEDGLGRLLHEARGIRLRKGRRDGRRLHASRGQLAGIRQGGDSQLYPSQDDHCQGNQADQLATSGGKDIRVSSRHLNLLSFNPKLLDAGRMARSVARIVGLVPRRDW
jgi:hypothetical protein